MIGRRLFLFILILIRIIFIANDLQLRQRQA
jgi:hypothetical protein